MANFRPAEMTEELRRKILFTAAMLFVEKGVNATSFAEIASVSGVSKSKILYEIKSKEELITALISYVVEGQSKAVKDFLKDKSDDKLIFYATETALLLYITEINENIRELYTVAYSLPASSTLIKKVVAEKNEKLLKEYLPKLESKDFYELEIASGGILRGFLSVPSDIYFTRERKICRFIESSFKVYDLPEEKIKQAIDFVMAADIETLAQAVIESMVSFFRAA